MSGARAACNQYGIGGVKFLKENIFGLSQAELETRAQALGLPAFRGRQVAAWMYEKRALDFSAMTNLPLSLRAALAERFEITPLRLLDRLVSEDGKTEKFLLGCAYGAAVETVLLRQPYGSSVCVSTQAGCAMGCAFCASTLRGLQRDLTCGEIFAQVFHVDSLLAQTGGRVSHVVLMGSGEPLLNYDNVLAFLRLCHAPYTLGLSYRNFTLSTCGIVPMIEKLAEEEIPLTLSISLHAPNQEIRSRLMPVSGKYPIGAVVAAGGAYAARTSRRVTYEYILIAGLNDAPRHAAELATLLKGQLASVNLIPANPVPERGFERPSAQAVARFAEALQARGLAATVRKEMGNDIQAACGQLRNRHLDEARIEETMERG